MAISAASFAGRCARLLSAGAFALLASGFAAHAETRSLDELLSAVVRVKTMIEPDARTADSLGREREGSGVVIDGDGLVLTIGNLMVEARTAEIGTKDGRTVPAAVVGYDHETKKKKKKKKNGRSADVKEADPVLVASAGGAAMVAPARVVAKREFAGSWEYLVGEALFTAPPHPAWSGAALINRDGRLVGIGSLIVGDAAAGGTPGNMFVPTDGLHSILGDLLATGRVSGPGRPWLGVAANEVRGALVVARVTPGGPAEQASVRAGDTIVAVNGETVATLAAFYRKVWAQGGAGAVVTLELSRNDETRRVEVRSMNRLDHLRLKSSL